MRALLRSLEARYGLRDRLARSYALLAVEAWHTASLASRAAVDVGTRRRDGRGRKPNLKESDRRQKRAGLALGTYDLLVRRLEALAQANGHGRHMAENLAARLLAVPPATDEPDP